MNHLNYALRGPYQSLPAEYWQNMSHPYFTPSVVHGYGTLHTTGMSFTPSMSNEPATLTFVPETQLSDRESPIEVVNLEKAVSNAEESDVSFLFFYLFLVSSWISVLLQLTPSPLTVLSRGTKPSPPPEATSCWASSSRAAPIGIWYGKVPKLTSVWIANRETPVADPSTSVLKISDDGNLVVLDASGSLVWSTTVNTTSNSTVAVLVDSDNLQLRDASNSSMVVWQSIDYPTNTWFPRLRLGLNKITGVTQRLTAWKNNEDPAAGIFNLELDPNGTTQYFILWNSTINYWSSGTWNGERSLALLRR
ncbi:hypothetical protein ZIOFF_071542 [Zingiber officinale]|uniref:Bulb-type lectin domain-containing protein n=1 Tax=Zingiber officinale TaxID=94328 RepID=A0A8J5C8F0_ZINOF|nr:hypothetical protein ZIOFF_071542 [Zingiber officinale]